MTMPSVRGRTVITGANTGIGKATALELARGGASLVLACRSLRRTEPVLDRIGERGGSATFVELDLASLGSVRAAALEILDDPAPITTLINNAGVAGRGGVTEDGFELAFGVNHLGHFLLTHLLLERIVASGQARIITVASEMHREVDAVDVGAVRRPARGLGMLRAYRVSKLANVLFACRLAELLEDESVVAVSVHPGLVASDIWRRIPRPLRHVVTRTMRTPEEGAEALVFCATAPDVRSGGYYRRSQLAEPSQAVSSAAARRLWESSLQWTGLEA